MKAQRSWQAQEGQELLFNERPQGSFTRQLFLGESSTPFPSAGRRRRRPPEEAQMVWLTAAGKPWTYWLAPQRARPPSGSATTPARPEEGVQSHPLAA